MCSRFFSPPTTNIFAKHRSTRLLWTFFVGCLLFLASVGSTNLAQAAPSSSRCDESSEYGTTRCDGNYRYFCDRSGSGSSTTYFWRLANTNSDYHYCQHGCYNRSGNAYCRCSNGTTGGQEFCSGNYRYQCLTSTYRYGQTDYANADINYHYCEYGCYTSSNLAYCKCLDGTTSGQYFCSGTDRYRCTTSTYRYGGSTSAACSSGYICSGSGSCVSTSCYFNSQTYNHSQEWCYNGSRYSCNMGQVSNAACSYGCYLSSGVAYCRCPNNTTSGQMYCSGSDVYQCNLSTAYYGSGSLVRNCAYGCNGGNCNECNPGSKSCSGNYVQECQSNGSYYQWNTGTNCSYGCYAGYCNECSTPGQRRCAGSYEELCVQTSLGNKWSQSYCGYGCYNGYCNQCSPNSRTCAGSQERVCQPTNNGYQYTDNNCTYGCHNGYCNQCPPSSPICSGNDVRTCSPTSTGYQWTSYTCAANQYCLNGTCMNCTCTPGTQTCDGKNIQSCNTDCRGWTITSTCSSSQYCENGQCKACTCTPNAKRCNGNSVETCQPDCSRWVSTSTCGSNEYCSAGQCQTCACTANQTRCKDNQTKETCKSDCTGWDTAQTCSTGQYCSNGSCVACLCTPGATRCSADKIQQCKSTCDGWVDYFTCNAGQYCENGFCKACACVPGTKHCNSTGQVETCTADCKGYGSPTNCNTGQYCVAGVCQVCTCVPGTTRCNGNQVETCGANCQGWTATQTCSSSQYCLNGACQGCVCQPGSKRCSNNTIQTCSSDCRAWDNTSTCPSLQTCINGTCKSCSCTPGERRCDGTTIQVCDTDCMKWNNYFTCQSSQYCEQGSCKTCICQPGTKRCNGNTAEICTTDCTNWATDKVCANGDQCVEGQCRPPGWCPDYNANRSSECNGKICQFYKCTTWECVQDSHCSPGQTCVGNLCKNQACDNTSTLGVLSTTCSNKSPDRPYCAVNECRACEYDHTAGLRTNSCANKTADKPYCAKYECHQCPHTNFTAFSECQNLNTDFKYCVNYQCGQCPHQWEPRDTTYCGGLPCKDYVCMQCSNSTDTPVQDANCMQISSGMPYCKKYKCVECPETNQPSNTCASKYTNKGFCNAHNFCVQCTENGFSVYCQQTFKKDYCSNGTCVECPDYNINTSTVCKTKYSNGSKPYCHEYRCVECPNVNSVGVFDNTYCAIPYATANPPKPYCAASTCVECPHTQATKTTACPSTRNICDGYKCHQCVSNGDCLSGNECVNNVCVSSTQQCGKCNTDTWCAANATTGAGCGAGKNRCRPKDNVCVQCLIDADCPGLDMRCDGTNTCVKSTCPDSCSSDLDCLRSDCGARGRCVAGRCTDVLGGTACQPPNLLIILDTSGSMKFGDSSLVNSGQQCSTTTDCINYMKTQNPSYTPRYTTSSLLKCSYDSNKGHNTCRFTRWDTAAYALMKVVKDYGGNPGLNFADRKVRFGLIFFSDTATLAAPVFKDPPELTELLKARAADGGTRYDRAFGTAETHLTDVLKLDAIRKRKSAILFITDGEPNEGCTAGPQKVGEIYNLADDLGSPRNIKTYAIGFGSGLGSGGESCLTKIAEQGRTDAKKCDTGRCLAFYAADSAASLANAFQDIINQATQEECDGLDNDCDGIIDNNAGGECSCVQSFTRPASTSALGAKSSQRQAGIKLFTFIAAYDIQGVCPPTILGKEDVKKYNETCRNNPTKAISCTPDKYQQDRPAGDAYNFYCNRCCNSVGTNTCSWSQEHGCSNTPWTGTGSVCTANCQDWCQSKKQMAVDCLMPRGFLRRSGTGYDSSGNLTVLSVTDFATDVLNKQKTRWLFVNLPDQDHRKQAIDQRPLIAEVIPDDYDVPTDTGTTWVSTGAANWNVSYKFDTSNTLLTPPLLGIETQYCGTAQECNRDRDQLIWTILGYDPSSGVSYRTHRMGPIYHSTPVISKAPRDVMPDPGYRAWIKSTIPVGGFTNKTVEERPTVVYVASNDGIIHAFHAETGVELWGVIPSTILSKMRSTLNGIDTDGSKLVTVDGTPLIQDIQMSRHVEQNNVVSVWKTVMIVGFRSGGRGYVAMDVTNPYRPRMMWEINHTSLKDPDNPSGGTFDRLGYTYGQPFLANLLLQWKGRLQERAVAVFPGGIQLKKHLGTNLVDQNETTVGAVVYVVDLETGIMIRELTAQDARGFASTPVGYGVVPATTTRVFAGDVLGQIFRIDLQSPNPSLWQMEKFYNLFPETTEVPMPIMAGLTISLNTRGEIVLYGGTGDIENVNFVRGFDKIFSIREKLSMRNGLLSSIDAIPNYVAKLDKYMTNENTSATPGPETTIKTPVGERLTGPAEVFNGTAYFTTYTPTTDLPICGVPGFSRVYGLHFNDQCRTENCFDALLPKETNHFYHQVLGFVETSVTPLACCEKDNLCGSGGSGTGTSTDLPSDDTFKSDPKTCGDLHYTVPMIQDKRTAQPYQYFRYLSMGANTLVMGVAFTYQPGETNISKQSSQLQGHNYDVKHKSSFFLSFQVAGKSAASSDKFALHGLREVIPSQQPNLQSGNYTTVGLAEQVPPLVVTSWGALLD